MKLTENELLERLEFDESKDWEVKSANGEIPASLWESYSAMANTDGGVIVLGVREDKGRFIVEGFGEPPTKLQKQLWNLLNNRNKVSCNLLDNEHIYPITVADKELLIVEVPRATNQQRPVYVGVDPFKGTYRRYHEGDYHCSREEISRMFADQSGEPQDERILESFSIEDLDSESVTEYRNRFSARQPTHPWLKHDLRGFLEKLGAFRHERTTGGVHLTVAGLLMFGREDSLRDAFPSYHLDYRERISDDASIRWTDRVMLDGTWSGNVFQFYQRVVGKLTSELKVPFQLDESLSRQASTTVHEAIQEALVNALIHADYQGSGGIVVERYRNRFEFSNPGTLLISREQLLAGGISQCRNYRLQQMFINVGYGDRAGSGFHKILSSWRLQKWRIPKLEETVKPSRVKLTLMMTSLLPEEGVARLKDQFSGIDDLSAPELQTLVTALVEEKVDNSRMQELCNDHPADLSRVLQSLVSKGFLRQEGRKRGAFYRLVEVAPPDNGREPPR